jgi:hypothetical protein
MIAEGLLPRFTLIEYDGKRPPLNEAHLSAEPSDDLKAKLCHLTGGVLAMMQDNSHIDIATDEQAQKRLFEIDKFADFQINEASKDTVRQLWNRAHVKVLKIAGIVAVGKDPFKPMIDLECVDWAFSIVENDILKLVSRFGAGKIGKTSDESKQATELTKRFRKYLKSNWNEVKQYGGSQQMHTDRVVPMAYLQRTLSTNVAYKNDRVGGTNAIKRMIAQFVDNGDIVEIPRNELLRNYNTRGKAYSVVNFNLIKEPKQ